MKQDQVLVRRTATVRAITAVFSIVLDKPSFDKLLYDTYLKNKQIRLGLLQKIFGYLSLNRLVDINERLNLV